MDLPLYVKKLVERTKLNVSFTCSYEDDELDPSPYETLNQLNLAFSNASFEEQCKLLFDLFGTNAMTLDLFGSTVSQPEHWEFELTRDHQFLKVAFGRYNPNDANIIISIRGSSEDINQFFVGLLPLCGMMRTTFI